MLQIGLAFLRQAEARLKDSKDALLDHNYPYAIRLAQECVELALKGVLKATGIEYPKRHDVGELLERMKERFPEWFQAEVSFLSETSHILWIKREPSMYGDETSFRAPENLFEKDEADDAVKRATRSFSLCKRLITELEKKIKEK